MDSTTLTHRVQLDRAAKAYIMEAIDNEGYDVPDCDIATPEGKLGFLYTTFKSEYGWAIARYGEYKAFTEWLMGLPTCFSIDFENYKILQLAVKWGSIPTDYTEKQADKILSNWWNFITVKTFQLFRKYKVN